MKMRLYGAVREAPLAMARDDDDACLCNYLPTLSYKPRSGFGNVLSQLLSAWRFKAHEHQLKQVRDAAGSTFDLGDCFRTEGAQPQAGSFGSSSTTAKPTPLIKTINVRNGLAHLTVETTPATPTLIND
ncbi:hypothetical protein FCULG_00005170 [Fusarium culmorum]|uniref:Uncharacterized protein n=1 Tax=Fusarium culmorum TaxID=5516 RepID=A0A2T4GX60_FUSCU|nr:hypothetical protein FCULG_00005170 [Fusarium culmorum]